MSNVSFKALVIGIKKIFLNPNLSVLELTNCGARGRFGPTSKECQSIYNGTDVLSQVKIDEKQPFNGSQVWTVPNEGYYT